MLVVNLKRKEKLPRSIRDKKHTVHVEVDNAIQGDQILIECRKPGKWHTIRGSISHNYFNCVANKNAYAVLSKTYTNVKK